MERRARIKWELDKAGKNDSQEMGWLIGIERN